MYMKNKREYERQLGVVYKSADILSELDMYQMDIQLARIGYY